MKASVAGCLDYWRAVKESISSPINCTGLGLECKSLDIISCRIPQVDEYCRKRSANEEEEKQIIWQEETINISHEAVAKYVDDTMRYLAGGLVSATSPGLKLPGTCLPQITAGLQNRAVMSNLANFEAEGCALGDGVAILLCAELKNLPHLLLVNFRGNELGDLFGVDLHANLEMPDCYPLLALFELDDNPSLSPKLLSKIDNAVIERSMKFKIPNSVREQFEGFHQIQKDPKAQAVVDLHFGKLTGRAHSQPDTNDPQPSHEPPAPLPLSSPQTTGTFFAANFPLAADDATAGLCAHPMFLRGLEENLVVLLQPPTPWPPYLPFPGMSRTILSDLDLKVSTDDDVPYSVKRLKHIATEQHDRILATMFEVPQFATWFHAQKWLEDHEAAVKLQNGVPPQLLSEFQDTYAAEMVATYSIYQMDSPFVAGDVINEHYDARCDEFYQTMNATMALSERAWQSQSNIEEFRRIKITIEEYKDKRGAHRAFKYVKDAVRMKFLYATTQDLKNDLADFVNRGVANTAMLVADQKQYQVLEIKPNLDPRLSSLYNVNVVVGIKSTLGGRLLMGEVQFVAWPSLGPGLEHLEYLRSQQHFLHEIDRLSVITKADFVNEVGRALRDLLHAKQQVL